LRSGSGVSRRPCETRQPGIEVRCAGIETSLAGSDRERSRDVPVVRVEGATPRGALLEVIEPIYL
jgi:hypothetical protein